MSNSTAQRFEICVTEALRDVARERLRQETLKAEGRFRYTCADRGMDDRNKLACLAEEFGEVAKAMLHNRLLVNDGGGDLRTELIHVAAVAVAWAESIPATRRTVTPPESETDGRQT